jgi:hypothetical protein
MTKFVEPLEIIAKVFQRITVLRIIIEEPWSKRIISAARHNTSPSSNASDSYLAYTRLTTRSAHRPPLRVLQTRSQNCE